MKIKIDKEDIINRLQILQNIVSQRSTLPILSNYLLETKGADRRLWITSTDLEIGMCSGISAQVIEDGAITVPARKFGEILHSFSQAKEPGVSIEIKENNRVQVTASGSRFQLAGIPREDYPALPKFREGEAFSFPGEALVEMIQKTAFASSTDETRYVLNGALFSIKEGSALMVATDGRRLALTRRPVAAGSKEFSIIVPAKALLEIVRVISHQPKGGPLTVLLDPTENQLGARVGDTTLFCRLIEGAFPNWEQVIPKRHEIRLRASRQEFLEATRRASLCIADRVGTCSYRLHKDRCDISSKTLGQYEFEESAPVLEVEGPDGFEVAFSPAYVLDFLKALPGDEFEMLMTSSVNPTLFRAPGQTDYLYVVMPARPQGG
jgi:DNA polymerase-3 subunit beta